jgi:phosphoribosylamine-glycine ligase
LFDDTLGQGDKAQALRAKGNVVVGGTPYTDRLEDDRSFGQEELKKEGINIVPYRDFDNFDDAIAYVKENPERYVIKPSGAAGNVKRRLFVGDEDDGQDVIRVLEAYKKSFPDEIRQFQLQRRVTGVEVAVGAFFNGKEFIYPLEFTARFGYPTISIQQEGMTTPIGQFLADLAAGVNPKLKVKSGFQIGVRIVVSPFPFDDDPTFLSVSKHAAILFKKGIPEEVHIEDVMQVNGQWYVAETSGVVLVVCELGQTMRQAQAQAYSRIRNIMIPDMYYRDDIGERWFEDHDKLHTWGYLREV